jgi:hypothetical protein
MTDTGHKEGTEAVVELANHHVETQPHMHRKRVRVWVGSPKLTISFTSLILPFVKANKIPLRNALSSHA